jgi:hydroxyacylglutathione hydrolase
MKRSVKMNDYKKNKEITTIKMGFVNSYIIKGVNKLILVDTGLPGNAKKIIKKIGEIGFKTNQVSLIILTHAHFDHFGSLKELQKVTGAKVAVHKNDAPYLIEGKRAEVIPISGFGKFMMRMVKNRSPKTMEGVKPDILIEDEMDLNDFGVKGKVISTPGHTDGSVSVFLDSGKCLAGDTIGATFGKPTYGMFCNDLNMLKESIVKIKNSNAKEVYLSHDGIISIDKIRRIL